MFRNVVLFTFIAGVLAHAQALVVTNGTAEPAQVRTGQAMRVRFYADIVDPNVLAGGVNLQRIGAAGINPVIVGTLVDDGTGGDEIAGDGRYSIYVTLTEPAATNITFVISAAIKNQILRQKSDNIVVSVMPNRPPVAVAGLGRSVRTATAVPLDGRNSFDLDNDLITFSWSITGKPTGSNAALDNSTFVKPVFTPDLPGTYNVRLLVNDGQATSAPSDIVIQASSTNAVPTAVIGGALPGAFGAGPTRSVALSGTQSFDPEATVLTYSWKLISKPASSTAPTLAPLTSANPTLTADKPGRYLVELTVSDGVNTSTATRATVILYKPNTPPVITVGADGTVTGATLVNLSGSATDPDAGDTIASLAWAFISKPSGSTAQLLNPATGTPSFTPDVLGDYLLELIATDSRGFLTKARVVIRRALPVVTGNSPPTVSAGAPQTITLPALATLAATASDDGQPNPPGALSISWIAVSGPSGVTFSNPSSLNTTATFYAPGVFVLRVTANDGALASSSDVTITVNDTGPTLSAVQDRTISVGDSFRLHLSANSTNPTAPLTFSLPAAPAGASFNPNPTIAWTPTLAQVGSNLFTARVADGQGRSDTKSFHVMVINANHPPVLADQADAMPAVGSTFTRTLTATDPDAGAILTYALVSGPAGMTLTGTTLNWLVNGTPFTPYQVICKVTDQVGASDVKKFLATPQPSAPPVANDDSYLVTLNQVLTVPAAGVLSNDANPSGGVLTASKLTNPTIGTLNAFQSNGGFTYTGPSTLPGPVFQPVVKTHVNYGINGFGAAAGQNPLAADLDGDGKPEVIVGLLNVGNSTGVAAFRQDGTRLWTIYGALPAPNDDCQVNYFPRSPYPYVVGDIDDDGHMEVVVISYCGRDGSRITGRLIALNGLDGSVKWVSDRLAGLPTLAGAPSVDMVFQATPSLARLRAGESPSILYSTYQSFGVGTIGTDSMGNPISGFQCNFILPGANYPFCQGLLVINGTDGSVRQRMASARGANDFDGASSNAQPPPLVLDLDGDGTPEIVSGSTVFRLDGSVKYQSSDTNFHYKTVAIAAANLDDTPDIEVIRLENANQIARLAAYKPDGSVLWAVPYQGGVVNGYITVADLDSSKKPSILVLIHEDLFVYDNKGILKWIYNNPDNPTFGGLSQAKMRAAAFDLDGDGEMEVVLQTSNSVLFLAGLTGAVKYRFDLSTIPGAGVPTSASLEPIGPIIYDADNNGHADVAVLWTAQDPGFQGNDGRFTILKNLNDDWKPVRKIQNQAAYFGANVNDDGSIPQFPLVNNFADPVTNLFGGAQPRIGPIADPRVRYRTSFTYNAVSGPLSSSPATVNLDIAPANRPPVFTSTPPTRYVMSCCTTLTYNAVAVDPDPGDTVTYSIYLQVNSGNNCSIGASTGVLICPANFAGAIGDKFATITLQAKDSFGAFSLQTLLLTGSPTNSVVPNVVGMTQAAAAAAIQSVGLGVGQITQTASASPAGTVTGQSPANGSLPIGELVALTVSTGPAPAPVPFVTGLTQSVANTTLANASFTAVVTHVFSSTVPLNTVVSQTPPAGTLLVPTPANPVTLSVSSGNGLLLSLNRSFITADQNVTVLPSATDVNGAPVATPSLTYIITPVFSPFPGTLPVISGTTVTASLTTRGSFRVTANDAANSRTASTTFLIGPPHVAGQLTHAESFASMIQALDQMFNLRPQLVAARAANNTAQMTSLLQQMVQIWRTVDLNDVRASLPNVPDDQFLPSVEDLQSLGQILTSQDLLVHQILRDANTDVKALTDGLKAPSTSITQLQALIDQFSTRAARLDGIPVSEIGGVYNGPEYTEFLAHRIPAFFEALMEELAQETGLGRRTAVFPYQTKAPLDMDSVSGFGIGGRAPRPESTLAEVAVTQAVDLMIDKIMDYASQTYKNAKQMAVDTMQQAAYSAAFVALASHLKQTLGGDTLENVGAVISGASLSFHEFSEPDMLNATPPGLFELGLIEAPADGHYPELTSVIIIGPSTIEDGANGISALVGGIKDSYSIGKDIASNPNRLKNLNEAKKKFNDLYKALSKINDATVNLTDVVKNAYQSPDDVLPGCIFSADPKCSELIYSNGIRPVYRYTPPPGFAGLGGLPVAILVIVQNDSGKVFIGTPVFLPAPVRPAP